MIVHHVTQGSPEWHALRAGRDCASDAAAMLGLSDKITRAEYMRLRATGEQREFSDWVQKNLLERGHEVEAHARRLAEDILGEDLFPATGTTEHGDLKLLASFDGITMLEDVSWECKLMNQGLRAAIENGDLPDTHWPQVEHQLLVSEADYVLFTLGDGSSTELLTRLEYRSRPERRQRVLSGWRQFHIDLAAYVPPEVIPAAESAGFKRLPALVVQAQGLVTSSNLALYRREALAFVEAIKTDLQVDQDFADAEAAVKFCSAAEIDLAAVKNNVLGQMTTVDEAVRAMDEISSALRAKRLILEKLVQSRKVEIRTAAILDAQKALIAHIDVLNAEIGHRWVEMPAADFATATKNKRTVATLRESVNAELMRARAAADEVAARVKVNAVLLDQHAEVAFLFADAARIVTGEPEFFAALVRSRVREHEEAIEARRLREQEAERQRQEAERARQEEAERQRSMELSVAQSGEAHIDTTKVDPTPEVRGAAMAAGAARRDAETVRLNTALPKSTVRHIGPPPTRDQVDALLDRMSEADLQNVLAFCLSIAPAQAAAPF